MTNAWKWATGVALVLAVVALIVAMGHKSNEASLGASGNFPTVVPNGTWFSGGIQVGPTGTSLINQQFGLCTLNASTTIPATTVKSIDCPVAGVRAGDLVVGDPPVLPNGVILQSTVASSTNGFVTFMIDNTTGATSATIPVANWEYRTQR